MSSIADAIQAKCLAFGDRVIKLNDYLLEQASLKYDVRCQKYNRGSKQHQPSDISPQTSALRHQPSDISPQTSALIHHPSYILYSSFSPPLVLL